MPVWIAAVSATSALLGTGASSVYQGRQLRDQRKLLRHQAGLLELQAQELRDATSHRLTEQAVLVHLDTWKSRLVPRITGDQPPTAILFPRQLTTLRLSAAPW
jgi:hypothetical protein